MPDDGGRRIGGPLSILLAVGVSLSAPMTLYASGPPREDAADFEVSFALQDSEGTRSESFAAGQRIILILTIRNRAGAARKLSLASAMACDFSVAAVRGPELWRWSRGQRFAQVLTDLVFAAGESKRFSAEWDATAADGAPAAAGSYRATAKVAALAPRVGPVSMFFTLR